MMSEVHRISNDVTSSYTSYKFEWCHTFLSCLKEIEEYLCIPSNLQGCVHQNAQPGTHRRRTHSVPGMTRMATHTETLKKVNPNPKIVASYYCSIYLSGDDNKMRLDEIKMHQIRLD